jgi:predicted dehydrogenase
VGSHFDVARSALVAGKHVLVEKPLAANSVDAEALCKLAATQRKILMVGHTFLYNNAVRKVKELIDGGELGEIRYVFCQRLNLGIVRSDVDALWNLAPHDIAILNYWIDRPIESVAAVGHAFLRPGISDLVFAHLGYEGNVSGHLHVTWLDPMKVRRATVVGTRRMLVYDDMSEDAPVTLFDKGININEVEVGIDAFPTYAEHAVTVRSGESWTPQVPRREPLAAEVDEFAAAIEGGRPPFTPGTDGLDVVRILERLTGAMTSSRTT